MSADVAIKRRRGRPSKITREQVLAAARTLAAQDLTMPAVANILGVKTPALYHHFNSREALVGEIGQQLFDGMTIPAPDPTNWRPWLHGINIQLYQFIVDNPLLIEASDSAQGFLSMTLRLCESILATLQPAGFEKQQSYWIMISLTQIAYSAARNQLEGSTTEVGREAVKEQFEFVNEEWPRTAEFMQQLPQKNNKQWLDQLLQWSITCIPDPQTDSPT
jgi:AcrR family transcriptional regulator